MTISILLMLSGAGAMGIAGLHRTIDPKEAWALACMGVIVFVAGYARALG